MLIVALDPGPVFRTQTSNPDLGAYPEFGLAFYPLLTEIGVVQFAKYFCTRLAWVGPV